ncbi:MAG: lipocalin-like domain-containing protein [Pseudomonadota bacterium]
MGALLAGLLCASGAAAQQGGFAGMGGDGAGFSEVAPGRAFAFPRDHGAHPGFRTEWWYLTANLQGPDGADYGLQWTLFRQALSPAPALDGWSAPQVWMAHAAATSADRHVSAERFARAGVGQAGVAILPFRAWIDDWRLESLGEDVEAPFAPLRVAASGEGFSYALSLAAEGPLVLQGEDGFSVKSEGGTASYYYSHPFLRAEGWMDFGAGRVPVSGRAWLDREWSSAALEAGQAGWDWFALHLPGGGKVMAAQVRRSDGGRAWRAGTWIAADGTAAPLAPGEVELTPLARTRVAGREVPTRWRVAIPSRGLEVEARAVNPKSWMATSVAYWEGPVRFEGTHAGVGYLEMTGY